MSSLLRRDGDDDSVGARFGQSNLEDKAAAIEAAKEKAVDLEDAQDAAVELAQETVKAVVGTLKALRNALVPGFITRYKNKKIHENQILDLEREAEELSHAVKKTIKKEHKHHLSELHKAKQLTFKVQREKHIREEVREALTEAKKAVTEAETDDYMQRRRLQIEEAQDKLDREAAEHRRAVESENAKLRTWRVNYWGAKAKELTEEAHHSRQLVLKRLEDDYNEKVGRIYDEWGARETAKTRMQVETALHGEGFDDHGLDLFGSYHDDEQLAHDKLSIGHVSDAELLLQQVGANDRAKESYVGIHEVHLFTSKSDPTFENQNDARIMSESDLERLHSLYNALLRDSQELTEASIRMAQLTESVNLDLAQVKNEHIVAEREKLGPPRQLPNYMDIDAAHVRKDRIRKLELQLADLEHASRTAGTRKASIDAQLISVAQELAVVRERTSRLQETIGGVADGLGQLPIVVGKSLSKVPGLELLGQPKELLAAIEHKSRAVGFDTLKDQALKVHREGVELDQALWLERQGSHEIRADGERVLNRFADISERLKNSKYEMNRLNLIDSLKLFMARKVSLRKVNVVVSGPLNWFSCHNKKLSSNISAFQFDPLTGIMTFEPQSSHSKTDSEMDEKSVSDTDNEAEGVTMGEGNVGVCVGVVKLPKSALWSMKIPICRQGKGPDFAGDEADSVTIRLGPSLSSLSLVGKFGNIPDPDTNEVVHDCQYIFSGDIVVFRFEFHSYCSEVRKHLAVGAGLFEERQVRPLEVLPDRDDKGRERVISSLVKSLRLQEKQSRLRETILLEELVTVEEAPVRFWDSALLNDCMQRFEKEYFLRLLRAEILMEHRKNVAVYEETQRAMREKALNSPREQRLQKSLEEYYKRRREVQGERIQKGMALIGRRIEILDKQQAIWRHVMVKQCQQSWIENGTVAKLVYVVQEYDDEHEKVGNEFEIDLSKVRYFDSAIQMTDEQTIQKKREQKAWQRRLDEITNSANNRIGDVKQARDNFIAKEQALLKSFEQSAIQQFRETCEQGAEEALRDPHNTRAVSAQFGVALLDIKKGIIKLDPKSKIPVQEQAQVVAEQRYKEAWIQRRLEDVQRSVAAQEEKMKRRVGKMQHECDNIIKRIANESTGEKYRLQQALRERREQEKLRRLKRLRFDPKVFAKAVPKAYRCEHLRSKAWGTSYANGVRCMHCGQELSTLHNEESQLLGYGTGADPELYEAVKRHRMNEQAYKFKTSEELRLVESERNRMEKERYELDLEDSHFYDFQDLTVLYKFDRRHAKEIKQHGIFRQGLQWTPLELEQYEANKVREEISRIAREGLVEASLATFDPLSIVEQPPPTFRAADERHRAQFHQLMFSMGRLQNFQKRVTALKEERLTLLTDRAMFSAILTHLHKDSYGFDFELQGIEEDLDKTGRLLSTYEKMRALWEKANKNMARAKKEKKRCEIAQCGVWDDVKECRDKVSFLHDETSSLLKEKVSVESKMQALEQLLSGRRRMLETKSDEYRLADLDYTGMMYRRPGEPVLTRYGYAYIRIYRARDDMVMLSLPWGNPNAKLWMLGKEIADGERSRQLGERKVMELEDESMRDFVRKERTETRKERRLMAREEEGLKEFWEFQDLGKYTDDTITTNVDEAVSTAFVVSSSKRFKAATSKQLKNTLSAFVEGVKAEAKVYDGPPSGKPKVPNFFAMRRKKIELANELQRRFIEDAAAKAERAVNMSIEVMRTQWIQSRSFEILMNLTIKDMIFEVANECLTEGRVAKVAIEKVSGIYFPTPVHMQHSTYSSLTNVWKDKKAELKARIDANRGQATKAKAATERPVLDQKQLVQLAEQKRRRREEKKRQAKMNAEMSAEEARCRAFYKWELVENLRERRLMKEEDYNSKIMRSEWKKAEAAATSTYNVSSGSQSQAQEAVKFASAERRRQELKEIAIERRRREEDRAGMIIEDKFGEALREVDRLERQKKQFIAEFGAAAANAMDALASEAVAGRPSEDDLAVTVPDWMEKPKAWDDWDIKKQIKYVTFQSDVRLRAKVIASKAQLEEERLQTLEEKSDKLFRFAFSVVEQKALELELEVMHLEEETKESEADVIDLRENVRKMRIFCRDKGEEELRARSELRKKEEYARRKDRELNEAIEWVELCERRAKNRDKIKRKISANCLWIDSDSITGFHQRFRTELLRKRLYEEYFRRTIYWIINRAEIIATERKLFYLQERLSVNREALDDRLSGMKKVWRSVQRKDLMRMKRSWLNQKFFPLHRRAILLEKFSSWVRFFQWNRGHKEAFTLKYETIKRHLDIERQFKQQLRLDNGDKVGDDSIGDSPQRSHYTLSALQHHSQRSVVCKLCHKYFLEAHNTSMSCQYHPEGFALLCPRSCPNPGLSHLCAAHRVRRWKCCDVTKPDALGCCRQYHMAEEVDPVYEKILAAVTARDKQYTHNINEKLTLARRNNWAAQLNDIRQQQLFKAEDAAQDGRDKVAKYHADPKLAAIPT